MNYEHRQMRCRLDRSLLIKGRRYRPGEIIEDGHLELAPEDGVEPAPEKPPPPPPSTPLKYAYPTPTSYLREKAEPPREGESVADPFGVTKRNK